MDDEKATANLRKHEVDFHDAAFVFDDPFLVIKQDDTEDYGEVRFRATGVWAGKLITVIYVERGKKMRIISARKANSHERRAYHQG